MPVVITVILAHLLLHVDVALMALGVRDLIVDVLLLALPCHQSKLLVLQLVLGQMLHWHVAQILSMTVLHLSGLKLLLHLRVVAILLLLVEQVEEVLLMGVACQRPLVLEGLLDKLVPLWLVAVLLGLLHELSFAKSLHLARSDRLLLKLSELLPLHHLLLILKILNLVCFSDELLVHLLTMLLGIHLLD